LEPIPHGIVLEPIPHGIIGTILHGIVAVYITDHNIDPNINYIIYNHCMIYKTQTKITLLNNYTYLITVA